MPVSANLDITHLEEGQNDKVPRINTARDNLEKAVTNLLSKAVTDGADTVLTTTEAGEALGNMVYTLTGALTANRNVEVPTNTKLYICENATTGGFSVTVKTNAGTGIAIPAGVKKTLYCDGTNVVEVGSGAQLLQTFPFGTIVAFTGSTGLPAVGGVTTSATVGYEATRAGSVVGIGVNLEVTVEGTPGTLTVEVVVAGGSVFTVQITTAGTGVYTATATQGLGIDAVAASDVIACQVIFGTFVGTIDNVIAHVELAATL